MSEVETIDVLIIGSGPSGTSTALHLVKRDPAWARRIVIVDKAVHPRDKLCGGGITHLGHNILLDLGLKLEPRHFEVREARLLYHGRSYSFFGNPVFRIVRRAEFDHWLVQKAEERGVAVRQGETVKEIVSHDEYVEVVTDKATYHAQVVVGADGSRSIVRRKLKWDDDSRVARLVEVLTPEDPAAAPEFRDAVAVFDFTPMDDGLQGYYWDFPSFVNGQPFMNRGLFDSRAQPARPKADLKGILAEEMDERERTLDDYELKGHPIRWWSSDGRFAAPRVILVGDAAGADPLMGEGISFALGYGQPASEAIVDAFARNDFSFDSYDERLKSHPLFAQLQRRTRLARLVYRINYPPLVSLGWRLMGLIMRFTPWKDRNYVPGRAGELQMRNAASQN